MDRHLSTNSTTTFKRGSTWIWGLMLFAAAVVCFVVGMLIGRQDSSLSQPSSPAPTGEATEQLYTCGMHPNVIQKGPGICPICNMKLTPLKTTKGSEQADDQGPVERKVLYWRAPMNPNYISDQPGKSPMGMDLVPVYAEQEAAPGSHTITIDPVTIQNMGIRTAEVKRGPLVKTIRSIGRVDYNEEQVWFFNTKFSGWIEKLHVDTTGQHVGKGQPLFDVYSRELYGAQEDYLTALRSAERLGGTSEAIRQQTRDLLDAARLKLKYLDISEEQIQQLSATQDVRKTLTILSPATGIVTEKMAIEGMYIEPGMKLYTIADLSRVWVYVDIYEYQLPWISVGQKAVMALPYVPGRQFDGKVVYIYPYLEKQTRVVRVRLEFENPDLELKPEMFANVVLEAELDRNALLIPRAAYIDSGRRQVAFQALGGGKFMPRELQTGVQAENDMVEVLHGLDEGNVVVTSGQFLIDAESKLKEAIARMLEPQPTFPNGTTATKPVDRDASGETEKPKSPMSHDTGHGAHAH